MMKGVFPHMLCCLLAFQWFITIQALDEESFIEKRAPSMGFQGMRGKKFDSDDINTVNDWSPVAEYIDKRAPMMGFQGVRGKKLFHNNNYRNIYQYKRIPMGFHGVRGKKNYEFPTNSDNDEYIPNNWKLESNLFTGMNENDIDSYDKRAPMMGFQGVRGKKDFEAEQKRAPIAGFFGVRGKKQPSGFFGMRGKKYPLEFRGKFVGVRGKKLLASDMINDDIDDNDIQSLLLLKGYGAPNIENTTNDNNNLAHLVNENDNEVSWEKRRMQGFIGMRGKKDTTENN